jgi:ferritin-like metal-binding protein YciE
VLLNNDRRSLAVANSPRENLVQWLRDAHAMEVGTLDDLHNLAARVGTFPELQARLRQHIEDTDGQERRLKELLEQLGAGTSIVKEAVSRVAGNVQAAVGSLFSDEVLKNTIAAYGFEHFEIGNYKALIATAAAAGETGAVTVLERNLREEEEMAQWLDRQLPDITTQYLRQGSNG